MSRNKDYIDLLLQRNLQRDRVIKAALEVLDSHDSKTEKLLQIKEILSKEIS